MEANSPRWTTVSDSPHDHEREALAFLRRRLYDRDPYRVWTNFEFTAVNGKLYEVDALAVTDNGVHLIEIKSHPGEIGGDGATWRWRTPEGNVRTFDNPRLLANTKAKALKEVLSRSRAFANHRNDVPYVAELVFLSDPDLRITLSPPGRHQVFGRDPEDGEQLPPQRGNLPSILAHLTELGPDGAGRPRRRIDRPTGAHIAKAIEEAGIRERSSRRQVGDYRIVELLRDADAQLDTGVAFQDFLVEHVSMTPTWQRRLRLYPLELNATAEQRVAADRAARRELQHLRPLDHPGILAPVDLIDHDRGPCLLFDHDPDAERLDRWLSAQPVLDVEARLGIVRQVAEALAHAHRNGVFHRALAPSAVYVTATGDDVRVRVADWHAGARLALGDTRALTGTEHVDALSADDAPLYRAPEHVQPLADPERLDVFSLGCLAQFVFTGAPPAASPTALYDLLAAAGCVPADSLGDALDDDLALFVIELTSADPARRTASMDDALLLLDGIEEHWTAPAFEEVHVAQARKGSTLARGRFDVVGRLGAGSTAFALLVRDRDSDNRLAVLKVARAPEINARIDAEAAALDRLGQHPCIVQKLADPIDLDGHAALLLTYAGNRDEIDREAAPDDGTTRSSRTLADRIGDPLGAELAERWGIDLLEAVRHLEDQGVAHRDIKPENLGIAKRGYPGELRLVLFDFSLAGAPLDRLDAGTVGYLDPFLGTPTRRRWDPAAERYAAAVVLHELCTGVKPVYGDGTAAPALVDVELRLDPTLFDASVADGLVAFFTRALARDVDARYGTAEDMLFAWRSAFRESTRPVTTTGHPTEHGEDTAFVVPPGTTAATPLAALPLSARAVAALERLEIVTVADLLGEPLFRLRQQAGIGAATRNELTAAVALLRESLADAGDLDSDAPLHLAARALVSRTAPPETVAVLRDWLGLDGRTPWPTVDDLAASSADRERVAEVLASARERWIRQVPVRAVRDWIAEDLAARGGLATDAQLAAHLAAVRPPATDGLALADDAHRHAATALVRAALVVEADRQSPRWVRRMLDGPVVVALDTGDADGNRLADHAQALAERTTALVAAAPDAIVPRSQLVAELRSVEPPAGAAPIADAALAELGAALAPSTAVNARLELYRRGMAGADALHATRRALVAVTSITPEALAAKVANRFPAAEPLPPRPDLDGLVAAAGLDLRWDPVAEAYVTTVVEQTDPSASSLTRFRTGVPTTSVTPVEIDVAADFEDRLRRAVDGGGLLVLLTAADLLERVTDELRRFPVTVVDVDEWLIDEIERLTAGGRPSWEMVLDADAAGPGSAVWKNLTGLVDKAVAELTMRLAATAGTVLLVRSGLLARYDRLDVVARWRDAVHRTDTPLVALWMLIASSDAVDVPMLDGRPVPVLTRNEWVRIPSEWARNVHRAGSTASSQEPR